MNKYINHVIETENERLTSGYRTAARPDHNGADYTDGDRLERTRDVYIIAYEDGTITDTTVGKSIGYSVSMLHAEKLLTRYFHMKANSVLVKVGQKVKKGQRLGIMGTTGDSTGIHLHFETKINSNGGISGTFDNPELWLTGQKTIKANDVAPTAVEVTSTAKLSFKVGDKVKVKNLAPTYTGGKLSAIVYKEVYDIIQISGDRVVIGKGKAVTAAVNIKDIYI